jgi:serine/threonine protein kinase
VAPEQAKRAQEILDAALRHDPEERDAFVDQACAGDPGLRSKVVSLLAAHTPTADFTGRAAGPQGRLIDEPLHTREGAVVGPYIIRHEIGRGGMGVVYLADDTRLSRRVALKALAPTISRDSGHRARMRQEARAAAALSHPGIATVYAFEEIDDDLYLACEYVPGQTLRARLESGPLPLTEVADIATQVARALSVAHAQGIVHRDLKPENVVRTTAGVVKILDFGVARAESLISPRLTQTGALLGTPAYMSPEQAQGHDIDFRTDLFSFGVLLYEMASGSNPFEDTTFTATIARIVGSEPAPLSEVCSVGSPALDRIVARCLRKQPRERHSSTMELVADLERLHAELSGETGRGLLPRVDALETVRGKPAPRWWWEFHQVAISVLYVLMIYPAWLVRAWLPPPWGLLFLFVVLACVVAATSLRLHLRFTASFYPLELSAQRARVQPWTWISDGGFATALIIAATAIGSAHLEVAALLLTVAVASVVARLIIEPATARAAFRGKTGGTRTPSRQRRRPSR